MNYMKILYVITSTQTGGAEHALAGLVLALCPRHQIRVVCLNPLGTVGEMLQQQGVWVTSLGAPKLPNWRTVSQLRDIIKDFQPDLVHAMLLRAVELCRFVHLLQPFKLVTTLHFDLSRKSIAVRGVDRFLRRQDTLTFAESLFTGKYLVTQQKYPKDKVYFLPNSVDRNLFVKEAEKREKMLKKYGFSDKNTVFVCVARLAPEKNHLHLLESFRDVYSNNKSVRLLLVGDGPERPNLEVFCEMNHLQDVVFFVGETTEVAEYLNLADVFVLISTIESLPLALLEAISMGLPCVVSNVGDMAAVVRHGQNGFVLPDPADTGLLSCFLTEMAHSAGMRETMSAASLQIAQERLLDVNAEYEKVYNQLVN